MNRVFKKPHLYIFIGIFLLYLILNLIFSGFYNTIPLIIAYAGTVNWLKLGSSLILTLIIGFLVAMTMTLIYTKYKERKECKTGRTLASIGTIGGLVTGVCPLCVTGLLPLFLGLFGVTFSFASLPFQGIEMQVLVVVLLVFSLHSLSERF